MKTRRVASLATAVGLGVIYVLVARLGLRIHAVHSFATLVWLPTGIALAALLRLGYGYWPSIAIGAFVANLWTGASPLAAAGIAAGNTLEALFGAWALRRVGSRGSLDRLADVIGLIVLAAVGGSAISATIGTGSLSLAGRVPPGQFDTVWRFWWLGDVIGALVVAPLLLTQGRRKPLRAARVAEATALGVLLVLMSLWIFEWMPQSLPALLSPLLVWAALRFEQAGAARATFLTTAIAVWATARGHGPFGRETVEASLYLEQAYMALSAATFLVLGAAVRDRRRAEQAREQAEAVIRDSEQRYRSLAEAVDQLMWIEDAAGRTTYVNRRWEEFVGGGLERAQAPRGNDLVHPDDAEYVAETRRRSLEDRTPYRVEYRLRSGGGQYRWVLARVVPVKDPDDRVTAWFAAAADIHDLKTAEEDLRRAKNDAEDANRAKDQFLAALSHELRTPLTPVLALASALERDFALPPDARRRLEIVRRNAELEARLIDDLLDLTRIAKGKLQLDSELVDVDQELDRVVEICREDADAKGVILEREGGGTGMHVRGDPARLQQVFWNILNNAVKFTPRGGRVVVRSSVASAERVAVEIRDTGSGIDPASIGRIFRPFEQAAPGSGGLGLGLAISTALVEAHGGTLTASSEGPGRGAAFRVELVATAERPVPDASLRPVPVPRKAGRRRVLLVDDHGDTLQVARDLLVSMSCDVVTAANVREALAAAAREPFDLVLSDLGLPDGNGLDLMRELRDRYALSGIAVSGYGMAEDLRRSREAGFVQHLVKPVTFDRLQVAVDRFFASRDAGVPA